MSDHKKILAVLTQEMENTMRQQIRVVTLMFIAVAVVASFASAEESSDEWQFSLAPLYLWASNIDGTMTVRGQLENDFHVNFGDAVNKLQMAFTVHFEARKGDWSLFADASYLDFSATQETFLPEGQADIDVTNLIVEGGGGYSFAENWWLIAGVRYFSLDSKIQFRVGSPIEPSESWADLFAGLAWRPKLSDRWTFSGRFDIGAGGSDLVWNAAAIFDVKVGKWIAILFGYRHLDYDYSSSDSSLVYDVSMSGPVAAVRFFW